MTQSLKYAVPGRPISPTSLDSIGYTPLDLPNPGFERQSFIDWFDSAKYPGSEPYLERMGNPWHFADIVKRGGDGTFDGMFCELFPRAVEIFKTELPFKRIDVIRVMEQHDRVRIHVDAYSRLSHSAFIEPNGYRCFAVLDQAAKTLFFKPRHQTERFIADVPSDYPFWVMNNMAKHGAERPVGGRKIIIRFAGMLDPLRHENLIARSAEKFAQYVIPY